MTVSLRLDGTGQGTVSTTIPFLDHMLDLLKLHSRFNLDIRAKGDTEVDFHHVVDDVGICLGQALDGALGDRRGIARYGHARVPMDEALADVTLDFSGRPYLRYDVKISKGRIRDFDVELVEGFFSSLCTHAGLTMHVHVPYGRNRHHIVEGIFKASAQALRRAVAVDPTLATVPSTKGVI